MERCTDHFVTLQTGAGVTSKCAAVRGDNSKYQEKKTKQSQSQPCLSWLCWWIKKFFTSKRDMAVAKNKMQIYESSSDSSQKYSNADIVLRACEGKLVSCECSC